MLNKILVVEDNTDARQMLTALLTAEGFDVIAAADGREGLDLIESERPDLIITDINMPRVNGLEMIKALRGRPANNDLPILVLTAYGDATARAAINVGANHASVKPIDFDLLLETIRQMLGP